MRVASKVDDNQADIVKDLRKFGCTVTCIHTVGKGVPDILVSYHGKWFVFEIKDGNKPKSQQKLTADEVKWHNKQKAPVYIITCTADALIIFNRVVHKSNISLHLT